MGAMRLRTVNWFEYKGQGGGDYQELLMKRMLTVIGEMMTGVLRVRRVAAVSVTQEEGVRGGGGGGDAE